MSVALLLVALAVVLWPAGVGARRGGPRERRRARPPVERRTRALRVAVTVAAASATAVLAGSGAVVAVPPVAVATWLLAGRLRPDPGDGPDASCVPLVLDLTAAARRAARPVADAVAAAAVGASGPVRDRFAHVAALIRLGAPAEQAWAELAGRPATAPVATAAVRSAASGARLAVAFARLAGDLRDDAAAAAETRAQRCGVVALVPLGLCFLPSFVLLGIVPVVVGIAGGVLSH